MNTIYTPYTYLIGWSSINKWYYGSRYATKTKCLYESGCHPDDLWKTYFTSSAEVKKHRELYGEPDVIQIRKTFNKSDDVIRWEYNVLKRMSVVHNDIWLNKNDIPSPPIMTGKNNPMYGKSRSEVTRQKISNSLSGRYIGSKHPNYGRHPSEETKQKISKSLTGIKISKAVKQKMSVSHKGKMIGENNPMYGRTGEKSPRFGKHHSGDTKNKISQSKKGRCGGENNPMYGTHHDDETKQKISKSLTGEKHPIVTCPHCGKSGGSRNMTRYHFDNCNHKLS